MQRIRESRAGRQAAGGHKLVAPVLLGAGSLSIACGPLRAPSPTSSAPVNSCSASPCEAYVQANDVECLAGVCVIDPDGGPPTTDLVVMVSLPQDAYFAPGATFALPYSSLASGADASAPAQLPATVPFGGTYTVTPAVAQSVGWDLGSPAGELTSLPFHATFRLLWSQGGGSPVEAQSIGLPVQPVEATQLQVAGNLGYPGPGGGSETAFQTSLPPASYEQTLTPDPPFDEAFGPVTQTIPVAPNYSPGLQQYQIDCYDTLGGAQPELQISRQGGVLDGWTAYLRDSQTLRTISNVASLSGSASNAIFAVRRTPVPGNCEPPPDALAGAELVVAPPANVPEPTGVFNLFEMLSPVSYPPVAPPVTVTGRVYAPDGANASATLIFEATSILGAMSVAVPNFEFTTSATVTDGAAYSVALPPGQYQVDVRPSGPDVALSVVSTEIEQSEQLDFVLGPLQTVTGSARVADGRPLAGAFVDAIGVQCESTATSSTNCLPRSTEGETDATGSYALKLDPGTYTLRVRPADGSALPWLVAPQSVVVDGVSAPSIEPIIVPAPMAVGLTLADPSGNAIPNALVRVFRLPAASQSAGTSSPAPTAVELGDAITGIDGSYQMYVAPPSP